jgi:hypothetical protein
MSTGEQQRLATWVLTRCTPEYKRDSLIGDLLEQCEARGEWWYWQQVLRSIRPWAHCVLLTAIESQESTADFIGDLILSIAFAIVGCYQLCLCASIAFSSTLFVRSDLGLLVGGVLMGCALMGVVTVAHEIRMRTARPH